ncbi:MAG: PqqD family protein [Clostridia bacterium]|nr:PqqD family protein [Clostridia bacterium]
MLVRNENFEIVNLSDEYMAIPVGEEATAFHGVVSLSEPVAFLLGLLDKPLSKDDILEKMLNEYAVEESTMKNDLDAITIKLRDFNLLLDT